MAESTIITGQFVRISQTPASIGERMLALIIDYFFLFIYVIGFSVTLSYLRIHAYSGFSFFFLFVIRCCAKSSIAGKVWENVC